MVHASLDIKCHCITLFLKNPNDDKRVHYAIHEYHTCWTTLSSSSNKTFLTSVHRVFDSFGFRRQSLRPLARCCCCCCCCCPRFRNYRRDPRPARPQLEAVSVFPPQDRASPRLIPPSTPAQSVDDRSPHMFCSSDQGRLDRRGGQKHSGGSTKRAGRPHGSGVGRKAGTVCAAIDSVAQTYRANKLSSPAHDSRGRLDPVLAAQLRGYSLADPEPNQRQALPAAVVEMVAKANATELQRAIGQQLVVGAFFFAMRSCKYSEASGLRRTKTGGEGRRQRFRLGGEPIRSVDEATLASADTVSVTYATYRTQKNSERGVTVTQHRTIAKPGTGLCQVRALAGLVSRVQVDAFAPGQWGRWQRDL